MAETETAQTAAHQTPSEAVRDFYAKELEAGTLSQADLSRLQEIAERRSEEFNDWAKEDGGPQLKDAAHDFVDTVHEHAPGLKEADADGVMTGQEFAKDGLPMVEGLFDVVQTVNDVGSDGAMIILEGSREIVDARAEMDGADPEVIQAQREIIDNAEADIEGLRDWRNEQLDQARDGIDTHRADIEAIPDLHHLPQPHEGADSPVDDSGGSVASTGAAADETTYADA